MEDLLVQIDDGMFVVRSCGKDDATGSWRKQEACGRLAAGTMPASRLCTWLRVQQARCLKCVSIRAPTNVRTSFC